MPDFGPPVAQNVDTSPAKGLQSLSAMMGLQQQQQGIQLGRQAIQSSALNIQQKQQEIQGTAADVQAKTQAMEERGRITKMMADGVDDQGNSIRNASGEPDPAKILPALGRIAPYTGQQVAQSILATHTAKVGLQAASTSLDSQQRAALMGPIQAIATNPQDPHMVDLASTAVDQWGAQHPEMAPLVNSAKTLLEQVKTAQTPEARAHLAGSLSAMLQGGQAVQTQPGGASIDTGSGVAVGTTAPPQAGGGFTPAGTVNKGVAPGTTYFTDQAGNTWATNPQNPGQAILVGHGGKISGGAPAATPAAPNAAPNATPTPAVVAEQRRVMQAELDKETDPVNRAALQREIDRLGGSSGPPTLNVGEADQVKANTATVTANRHQATDAQTQHDILNRIQSLASTPGLYLGPGSKNLADLATAVSALPGMEGAAKYANNYNELVKFMAQNVARQGQSMGLTGSDARLDAAIHANPNADPMDKRTVQNVAQYMGGIVRMNLAKADAMDRWLQQPGNSLQTEHQFEKLWRDNADPRLFQLAEMKDQGEASSYSKVHIRPSEAKALQAKHDVLQKLGAL